MQNITNNRWGGKSQQRPTPSPVRFWNLYVDLLIPVCFPSGSVGYRAGMAQMQETQELVDRLRLYCGALALPSILEGRLIAFSVQSSWIDFFPLPLAHWKFWSHCALTLSGTAAALLKSCCLLHVCSILLCYAALCQFLPGALSCF